MEYASKSLSENSITTPVIYKYQLFALGLSIHSRDFPIHQREIL